MGLHNTSQSSPFLSVRARIPDLHRGDLEGVMWESWELARIRAMRLTLFIFPTELLEVAAAATRHLSEGLAKRWMRDSGLSTPEFERLADAVDEALSDGPRTARDLRAVLAVPTPVDLPGVVARMCDAGRLVGGRPPRSWRSGVRQYHRWEDVLPDVDIHRWNPDAAIRELIARYIDSYGPVTIDDISWWTGFTKHRCRDALQSIDAEQVEVTGWKGPLFQMPESTSVSVAERSVNALPILDPYVQGYRNRGRLLDPKRHTFVYDGGGNSASTLVYGGRIIGVWQTSEDPGPSIRYHLFSGSDTSVRQKCEVELAAAGALYFDRSVDVIEVPEMEPLNAGGGRSAMHPLDNQIHRASRRAKQNR